MPIRIVSNTYTDIFGNALGFYKANAGDRITLDVDLEVNISVIQNQQNNITLDWVKNEFNLISQRGWLTEGFRLGDTINWYLYNKSDGTLHDTKSGDITYVDESTLRIDTDFGGAFDESIYIQEIVNTRVHADLELNINHIFNDSNPAFNSLIDGELTKVRFTGLDSLADGVPQNGLIVGNQSGQYLISAVLERNTDAYSSRIYTVTLEFIQSGVRNSDWFSLGNCLKLAIQYKFYSLPNETAYITTINYSETANTGWFNVAYNGETIDSTLTTGIDEIDYAVPTTTNIVVETSATEFYLGAQHVSIDENYYKNKVSNQLVIGDVLDSYVPLAVGTYTSTNGLYEITVNSINTVSTTHTINITFTPLAGFETLFDSFDDGDKLFYLWLKAGNVNHLVFSSQLTKAIETSLPLNPDLFTWIRHNVNSNSVLSDQEVDKTNTEDDLGLFCKFDLTPSTTFDGVRVSIVATNSVSGAEFTLESMFFDLSNTQINSSGQYLLDVEQGVTNNLPLTSEKKKARLYNDTATDKATIYYPFLNRWEYWLNQINANSDFYPNQKKNWVDYITGNWTIVGRVALETGDIQYTDDLNLPISDYDTEPDIVSVIQLYRENGNPTSSIFAGELMTIEATHTWSTKEAVDSWGMITIEQFEGAPRYILSTVVNTDEDDNNPLIPFTGLTATKVEDLTYTVLTCQLDTTKLVSDNVKIGSKIFAVVVPVDGLQFQNGDPVQFQNGEYANPQ